MTGQPTGEPDLVGQVLDGKYQLMRRIGEGQLCTTYEARHGGSGRHFAIKVLKSSLAVKPPTPERFLHHVGAAQKIKHGNVLSIEEFGHTPQRSVFAAMELAVGDTLHTIMTRDGKWPWDRVRPVARQLAAAIAAGHQVGVIHRAVRPANVFLFLDPRGKREPLVKVADFGLVQVGVEASQASPDSTTTTLFGDPEYMAPEQGMGGQVTPQSDIYSLGVVLFRFLTGQVPFAHANAFKAISMHAQKPVPPPRSLEPSIPPDVEQIILRCLGKTPDQRFGSAVELERAIAGAGAGAAAPGPAAAAPAA